MMTKTVKTTTLTVRRMHRTALPSGRRWLVSQSEQNKTSGRPKQADRSTFTQSCTGASFPRTSSDEIVIRRRSFSADQAAPRHRARSNQAGLAMRGLHALCAAPAVSGSQPGRREAGLVVTQDTSRYHATATQVARRVSSLLESASIHVVHRSKCELSHRLRDCCHRSSWRPDSFRERLRAEPPCALPRTRQLDASLSTRLSRKSGPTRISFTAMPSEEQREGGSLRAVN